MEMQQISTWSPCPRSWRSSTTGRARRIGPGTWRTYATLLQSYIGTGLTHLLFLQEAATMSLQQLQAAELKELTTVGDIADKLKLEVKPASRALRSQ
jgi:hypothetical protein